MVDEWLKPLIGLGFVSNKQIVSIAHSDSQINSIIARALLGQFEPHESFAEKDKNTAASDGEALSKGVISHYVRDILEGEWRGNTFALAFRRVWQDADAHTPSATYTKPVERAEVERAFDSFFAAGTETQSKSRSQPSSRDRLFLRCYYGSLTAGDVIGKLWHVDHIVPVGPMAAAIKAAKSDGLPVNSIANYAAVPSPDNLKKGQSQLKALLAGNDKAKWRRIIETYYFVDQLPVPVVPTEAQVVANAKSFVDFEKKYRAFLDKRWAKTREGALEHFTKNGWLA